MSDIRTLWMLRDGIELPPTVPKWLQAGRVYHGLPYPGQGSIHGVKLFELGMGEGDGFDIPIRFLVGADEGERLAP